MEDRLRVVIAEDEAIVRQGLCHLFDWAAEGMSISGVAHDGLEALSLIDACHPHILLTDIVMPQMDGLALIEQVRRAYPKMYIIVLSAYDDASFVERSRAAGADDYVLKPTIDSGRLLAALRKAASRWRVERPEMAAPSMTHRFSRRLMGYPEKDEPASLELPGGVRLVGCQSESGMTDHLFAQALGMAGAARITEPFEATDGVVVCAVAQQKNLEEKLARAVNTMAKSVPYAFLAVTEPIYSLSQVRDAYEQQLLMLLKQRFYMPDCRLLLMEDYHPVKVQVPEFDEQAFARMLQGDTLRETVAVLQRYVQTLLEARCLDEYAVKSFVQANVYRILSGLHGRVEARTLAEFRQRFFAGINRCVYAGQLNDCLDRQLDELRGMMIECEEERHIQRMLSFIEDHYSEPLTLGDLAQHLNLNYSYVSTYFRANASEGFTAYLNRVRIEHAKTQLCTTNRAVADICYAVGFSDLSHFGRVFRKLTGQTPKAYRMAAQKEDEP